MKFNTDKTRSGYEILSLYGPDKHGDYVGVVIDQGRLFAITWDEDGKDKDYAYSFDLVPSFTNNVGSQHPLKLK